MDSRTFRHYASSLRRVRSGLVLLALVAACGTSDPPESTRPFVVRALLAAGRDSQFVDVGRARDLPEDVVPPLEQITGATVVLHGPDGAVPFAEAEGGRYGCACEIAPGNRYAVTVTTPDGVSALGITHVPLTPHISPAQGTLSSRQTLVELTWPSVTSPGRYGIYWRTPLDEARSNFLLYTPDTLFTYQPLGLCGTECCDGEETLVVAYSPSVLNERGFPAAPGSSDTLTGAVGFVGSAATASAIFRLANAGTC